MGIISSIKNELRVLTDPQHRAKEMGKAKARIEGVDCPCGGKAKGEPLKCSRCGVLSEGQRYVAQHWPEISVAGMSHRDVMTMTKGQGATWATLTVDQAQRVTWRLASEAHSMALQGLGGKGWQNRAASMCRVQASVLRDQGKADQAVEREREAEKIEKT